MSEKISTIILSSNESLKKLISLYLGEYGGFECFDDFSDLSDVYNTLSSQSKTFLIVDLNDGIKKYADFLQKTDFSNCRVLAISDTPEVDLIVRVMRLGVKEFLSSPIIKTEFFDVLKRVAEQLNGQNQKTTKSRMITVFSNKGGIGKTSVAANLAFELAKITKENVALVDLNFQFGDITTFMDLHPTFNISYMLKNPDKINKDFLLNTMEKYKNSSLYVLADPPVFKQAEEISRKEIENLISVLKETFSYIVVDTDSNFDSKTITALDNSDLLFLVTIVNLPALRNCQRCLDLFEKLGYDSDKVQILINRYMENDEIKISDVEKLLNKQVYWKIPNNYFTLMAAINKGVLVSEINATSNVAISFRELAMNISDSIYRKRLINKYSNNSLSNIYNILRG
ncbi:AAA family ATPase [Spirochaetes bacterium]|uniref:AAA family ATPase n=1 Tax=Candidatus Scatousia excrementipullorum TaxID=2840936 RepID=A0A9D9DPP6_9BACT|nr:AAA family ATPase [Candidatus Scatousia excrementipullorum]